MIYGLTGAPASVTGTLVETTLATVALPALSSNSRLRIRVLASTALANANAKTVSIKYGGTLIGQSIGLPNNLSTVLDIDLFNRNSTGSQVNRSASATPTGPLAGAFSTYAIDTSVPKNLTITAQLGTTTDTITLEGYCVEVMNS